jgi:hypothetical protein
MARIETKYPPVQIIGKLIKEEYLIDKYMISKGLSITISQYHVS